MGEVKQINIKNRTYYFYNDIINIKNLESKLLKIDKKNHTKTLVFTILDILQLKKLMIAKIFTVWILCICLLIMWVKKGVNKYLIFDYTDENKDLLKKYNDIWDGIRDKIKEVSCGECDYEEDYMKIKFNSDNDLPLNKPLKFHLMTITIRSVFEKDGELYPQVFVEDTLYELNV